ncbi:hypothetical protein [Escherichia coli]|uniref:hypothetical protein n=1 Tax=Escherichia coli TaxID=562 RepID=UPI0038906B14
MVTARPAAANALPVLVAVRVDRQGQGLLALECGELLGRQQVVVEVALLQIVGGDKLIIPFC